jgi:XTP/dITP diphosphohydrolase
MKKLVLATHNKGKVRELGILLSPYNIEVISAGDLNIPEPEETGLTFHENARLKAVHSAQLAKLPALADDSGLCIPALGGQPGIYSARWGGPEKDFAQACEKIKQELIAKQRALTTKAYFTCVLSLAQPDGTSVEFEGRVDGRLTFPARGDAGFGYDPIFVPSHSKKTYGEMNSEEKNARNHRQDAFDKFKKYLLQLAA